MNNSFNELVQSERIINSREQQTMMVIVGSKSINKNMANRHIGLFNLGCHLVHSATNTPPATIIAKAKTQEPIPKSVIAAALLPMELAGFPVESR